MHALTLFSLSLHAASSVIPHAHSLTRWPRCHQVASSACMPSFNGIISHICASVSKFGLKSLDVSRHVTVDSRMLFDVNGHFQERLRQLLSQVGHHGRREEAT